VIPDSCRSNFRPFYLHPPHALLSLRSLLAEGQVAELPFFPSGRFPFWASPSLSRLASASGRIEFIILLIMDWSFASGCSPPHLSATQFPSATDSQCSVRRGLSPHCWCALSGALSEASPLCLFGPRRNSGQSEDAYTRARGKARTLRLLLPPDLVRTLQDPSASGRLIHQEAQIMILGGLRQTVK
jgi:hypothetical protein